MDRTNNFLFISYYTRESGYEIEANKLRASILALRAPFAIVPLPSLHSWDANTRLKAPFILEMILSHPEFNRFVFVDADAIVNSYPMLFETIDADIAAHLRNWRARKDELLSGTLFFRRSDLVLDLLRAWIELNEKNPAVLEQRNLQTALSYYPTIRFAPLPLEYCMIFDAEERKGRRAVIEHFQKSRRYKKTLL